VSTSSFYIRSSSMVTLLLPSCDSYLRPAVCRQYYMVSSIGWTCQRGSLYKPSWCTAACMVRHLGTSSTISVQPPTSHLGFVSVPRTDSNFSYLAVHLTGTAVGLSSLLVRWCGIRYLTNSETRHVVQTVLNSS